MILNYTSQTSVFKFQTSHIRVLRYDLLLNPTKILKILMGVYFFLKKIKRFKH
jgi:hypothetical protein